MRNSCFSEGQWYLPTLNPLFFSLSAAFAFCVLLTDFLGFYYLQTFCGCIAFECLYMFFVSFLCFAFGVAFPFGFISTLKQKFQSSKYFFSRKWKIGSKMRVNARARGLFVFIWKSIACKKVKIFFQKNRDSTFKNWLKEKLYILTINYLRVEKR